MMSSLQFITLSTVLAIEIADSTAAQPRSRLSAPADETQLYLDEIRNSTRNISSLAKRARPSPAGKRCVDIQCRRCRAIIAAHVVIGRSKRWQIRLVLIPIGREEPGKFRALVNDERGVVFGSEYFIDETSDLVPSS